MISSTKKKWKNYNYAWSNTAFSKALLFFFYYYYLQGLCWALCSKIWNRNDVKFTRNVKITIQKNMWYRHLEGLGNLEEVLDLFKPSDIIKDVQLFWALDCHSEHFSKWMSRKQSCLLFLPFLSVCVCLYKYNNNKW